jgi:cytochrome c oxidase subunit 1
VHGNWGEALPVVHRWAYAYSVPGAKEDFIAQDAPAEQGGDHEPYRPPEAQGAAEAPAGGAAAAAAADAAQGTRGAPA